LSTIAIIGAGPGLGLAIGRRFGAQGFRVALIFHNFRNPASLRGESSS
jgi:NAD(P)-dependent dehydrogenase (short-subunit alcohol dehydrogenase family)